MALEVEIPKQHVHHAFGFDMCVARAHTDKLGHAPPVSETAYVIVLLTIPLISEMRDFMVLQSHI